jgi:hypothetical protein
MYCGRTEAQNGQQMYGLQVDKYYGVAIMAALLAIGISAVVFMSQYQAIIPLSVKLTASLIIVPTIAIGIIISLFSVLKKSFFLPPLFRQ